MSNLKEIPLSEIRENPVALRTVDKTGEDWQGFVDSIRLSGIMNAISVRQMKDTDTNATYYTILDGLHRYTGACEAGLATISAKIITANEAESLKLQLMANVHKIETKHHQYAQQLTRIMAYNPTMTAAELAASIGKSSTWISQRLSLLKLDSKIGKLVDDGEINLSNAYVLTKLPVEEQAHFIDRAMLTAPAEFTNVVNTRAKEIRDAKREGRAPKAVDFQPMARLRKLGEIKPQMESPQEILTLVRESGARTPAEIVTETLKWVCHLDTPSVEQARAKDATAKAEEAANKERRKAEQLAKKEKAAAEAQQLVLAS